MKVTEGTFHGVNGVELFYSRIHASREAARGEVNAVHGHVAMRHRPFDALGLERFFADMLSWMDRHTAAR
ncbi:hypothetical protein [Gordoniibacillus kamchatkensis]|uniref:hypothetical protein n=1 Tax=Gordoniibacillus kamchatkensis TaxID=1590651 RepID=UPI000ADC59B6|nr:hypothetical protein [Paenibacillus sp. VKM B-2647]